MKTTKNTFINFIVLSIVIVLIGTVLTFYPRPHTPAAPAAPRPAPAPANSVKNLPDNLPVNRPQEPSPIGKLGDF